MTTPPTPRFGFVLDELDDGPPDGPNVFLNQLAGPVEAKGAIDDQGTYALRPVSTPGTPGIRGRYYMVKGDPDLTKNGILWRDHGTGWDAVPQSVALDAQTRTSNITISATTEAGATTILNGHSVTYDGGLVEIRVWLPRVTGDFNNYDGAPSDFIGVIYRDSTVVGRSHVGRQAPNGAQAQSNASVSLFDTPSAGTHVYSFRAFKAGPSPFTVYAGPGGSGEYLPAFMRITKAG